jgi:predicted RNA-binding Zn ribbon-like protein
MTPEVLVRLANLTVPRRPGRGPKIYPDPLARAGRAAEALGLTRVNVRELEGLRELHEVVVELVDRLLDGRSVQAQATRLTRLADGSRARARLEQDENGAIRQRLRWTDSSVVASLARQVMLELGAVEPTRLRRCERPECELLFYDTTRSNTQRWHAQSPCGQRERQQRHRTTRRVSAAGTVDPDASSGGDRRRRRAPSDVSR